MAVGEAHRYSSGPPQPKADRSWCIHTANIKCIIINNKPRRRRWGRRQQQGAELQWPAYCAVSLHTGNRSSNPSAIPISGTWIRFEKVVRSQRRRSQCPWSLLIVIIRTGPLQKHRIIYRIMSRNERGIKTPLSTVYPKPSEPWRATSV